MRRPLAFSSVGAALLLGSGCGAPPASSLPQYSSPGSGAGGTVATHATSGPTTEPTGSGSNGTGSDGTGSDGTGSDGTGSDGTGSDGTGLSDASAGAGSTSGAVRPAGGPTPTELSLASMTAVRPGGPSPIFATGTPTVLLPGPSPWTRLPTLASGPNQGSHTGVVLTSSVARTAEEKRIVAVYVAYWSYVMKAQYAVRVDAGQLDKVATGSSAQALTAYVAYLRSKKARTIGWESINVTSIVREGGTGSAASRTGLLSACVDNGSVDVQVDSGAPIEALVPAYDTMASVSLVGTGLRVSWAQAKDRTTPCPKPGDG